MTADTNPEKASEASKRNGPTRAESGAAAIAPMERVGGIAKRNGVRAKPATKEKAQPAVAARSEPRQTKAATVETMLSRKEGVSLEAMCTATGWQAHTCRAFLTGLRKKGKNVIRDKGKDGTTIYRIGPAAPREVGA